MWISLDCSGIEVTCINSGGLARGTQRGTALSIRAFKEFLSIPDLPLSSAALLQFAYCPEVEGRVGGNEEEIKAIR